MSHLTRRLIEGLDEVYKREHPEETTGSETPAPAPEETEAAAIAAFGAALYGTPAHHTKEEPRHG